MKNSPRTARTRLTALAAVGMLAIGSIVPAAIAGGPRSYGPDYCGPSYQPDYAPPRRGHGGYGHSIGTIRVNGRAVRISEYKPNIEIARAFRSAGYRAKVVQRFGRTFVRAFGCADVHWKSRIGSGCIHRGAGYVDVVLQLPRRGYRGWYGGRNAGHDHGRDRHYDDRGRDDRRRGAPRGGRPSDRRH